MFQHNQRACTKKPFLATCGRQATHGLPALLTVALLQLPTMAVADVIGDADGDGRFGLSDVTYVESLLDASSDIPAQSGRLSDVAFPCDGVIDEGDLFALRRASRGSDRSSVMMSDCHGVQLGETFTGFEGAKVLSLDEHYAEIAEIVPAFGGFYFDEDDQPTVVLTEESEDALEQVRQELEERLGAERFGREPFRSVPGEYGFTDLFEWREAALEVFAIPRVVSLDIDEANNRLAITMETWDSRLEVENLLEGGLGIPLEAVTLALGGRPQMMDIGNGHFPLLRGGIEIGFAGNGGSHCTMGPIVNRGGQRGWLTNSHCTLNMGTVDPNPRLHQPWDQTNDSPPVESEAGRELIDPKKNPNMTGCANVQGPLCRYSDSAFILIEDNRASSLGRVPVDFSQASPTGERFFVSQSDPCYGEKISKTGRTSGYTAGKVTGTCLDVLGESGHLRCQYLTSANIDSGDSGSPVFRVSGLYNAEWVGIAWGSFGGLLNYFSPLSGIEKDLGNLNGVKGNDPPKVTILNPQEGQSVGQGAFSVVNLQASVWDPDHGLCSTCQANWVSSEDGPLGTSTFVNGETSMSVVLGSQGPQSITVTVTDPKGATGTDTVSFTTGNSDPGVWITQPSLNAVLWRDTTYLFQGSSFDAELFGPLPCTSLMWTTSDNSWPATTGCAVPLSFSTNGSKVVLLKGTDSQNKVDYASVYFTVVDPPSFQAPEVTILKPAPGDFLPADGIINFSGVGNDPDDGSPLAYEWVVKGSGLVGGASEIVLFTQNANDNETKTYFWKPSDDVLPKCGGRNVQLELRVTDPENKTGKKTIPVTVAWPPC